MKELNYFKCLNYQEVITAKVSDHNPVVHNNVLFWNVMMQGKLRNNSSALSFNNAFGLIETDRQYVNRLTKVAEVIAEIIENNPAIKAVAICEGPIKSDHISVFIKALMRCSVMDKFFNHQSFDLQFYKPTVEHKPLWGLMLMVEDSIIVEPVRENFMHNPNLAEKLANRFQLWKLSKNGQDEYLALAHFPFGKDESVIERKNLSETSLNYCHFVQHVLNKYANKTLYFCADFNFNPYLINAYSERDLDKINPNNSVILSNDKNIHYLRDNIKPVTVDGILLSQRAKQKFYTLNKSQGLFFRLSLEYNLSKLSNQEAKDKSTSQTTDEGDSLKYGN